MSIRPFILLMVAAAVSLPRVAVAQSNDAAFELRAHIADSVLTKMHFEEQQKLVITSIGPLFASQVLNLPADQLPSAFLAAFTDAAGRSRIAKMLSDAYAAEYLSRLPDLKKAVVKAYATRLSMEDLKALDAFLDTPAGRDWSASQSDLQRAGADAGRQNGALAGVAAIQSVAANLNSEASKK